jgi:hypothetical protein
MSAHQPTLLQVELDNLQLALNILHNGASLKPLLRHGSAKSRLRFRIAGLDYRLDHRPDGTGIPDVNDGLVAQAEYRLQLTFVSATRRNEH